MIYGKILSQFLIVFASIFIVSITYNNCAKRPFVSQSALSFANSSLVPIEQGQPDSQKSCTGDFPSNASLCFDDHQNLQENSQRVLVSSCSANRKCEFICNAGYNFENGACQLPAVNRCAETPPCANAVNCTLVTGTPMQVNQAWVKQANSCGFRCNDGFEGDFCERVVPQNYSCTGVAPANALMCTGDDLNLAANASRIVVNSCTSGRKCEYTCQPGFNNVSGVCVAVAVANNSCAATVPCMVGLKCTTITGNPTMANQAWIKNATTCGFTCTENFEGNFCENEKPPAFTCQGATPTDAILCAGDESDLIGNGTRRVVSVCTTNSKCEYVCDNGFNNENGTCIRQTLSCQATLPCVNGLNCQLRTGTPTQVNQPWVKSATNCGFTCLEGYEGDLCEKGAAPPLVSCVNAQNTLPLVTHWSETKKAFEEGAADRMTLHNPNPTGSRQFYNHSLLPRHNNYIGENYEYRKIADSEYLDWSNGECQRSGIPIEHRKPSSYSDWLVAKSSVLPHRGTLQLLYGLISDKSLVAVILPPGWKPTDPPGKYPIVFSGHYDLANHLVSPNHQMFQTLSLAYKNDSVQAIGVLWNGAGAVGSRSMQSNARSEFNKVIQKVRTVFAGDAQRIFIYGGSRGGLTALSMTANPENFPYKVVACFATVPPADIPLVASLTGSTVPLLLGAAEWSIGTLDTWRKDFVYAENNELKGMKRNEAHLHILTGTKNQNTIESTINLSSPYILNALKEKAPRLFLELGSHDFIVPWVDQFKFLNVLKKSGLQFESRINYLAGHYADSASPNASSSAAIFASLLKKIADGNPTSIFQHGRHLQFLNDYKSKTLLPIDGQTRFTLEIPRVQTQNIIGHAIMTGIPKTKYKMAYTYNGADKDAQGIPYSMDGELDSDGVAIADLSAQPLGNYVATQLEILKPDTAVWKKIDLMNGTTNWERGKLIFDVVDETAHGVTADHKAEELQKIILQNYLGLNFDLGTNGFTNISYGVVED